MVDVLWIQDAHSLSETSKMARRPPPPPQKAMLTPERIRQGIQRLERRIAEVEAFDPQSIRTLDDTSKAEALEASVKGALEQTFGPDTVEFQRYQGAASFHWPINLIYPTPIHEIQESLRRCRARSIELLNQAVSFLKEELEAYDGTPQSDATAQVPASHSRKVFLVHGQDNEAKNEVARFLDRIGLEAIILHERANAGWHLLTKFQEEAGDVGFAVVLITPDDTCSGPGEPQRSRPRQNVVFELGFFIGKFGTARVAALVKGEVERPSDFDGVGYITMDQGGGWKLQLARELDGAKVSFDHSSVLRA
jgi:predicted nucleotide-binding protein